MEYLVFLRGQPKLFGEWLNFDEKRSSLSLVF